MMGMDDLKAGGPPAAAPAEDGTQLVDLSSMIDKTECYAKNQDSAFPMTNLFLGDSRLGCKSDADEQLIIHVGFQQFVKLQSIKLTEFNLGSDPELKPTILKIFVNRQNIGFEDAQDIDPTQEFELTDQDLGPNAPPLVLKLLKFNRVQSITLFIEDNNGGEITALGGLKLFGKSIATTNMNDLKKSC